VVGIRPGEKLHEVLVNDDESRSTLERDNMYVVTPTATLWQRDLKYDGQPLPDGFRYSSDTNPLWLSEDEIKEMVMAFESGDY
jgi:UDP-N-acetylglucosamine 4,6-dehydratase/5-epimerase